MTDAWDLVPDNERTADRVTTFILFCEDTVNEPSYFRNFNVPGKLKVNVVEGQLTSFRNIINTLQYCEREGLLEIVENGYAIKSGTTHHIWSVFDRDVESENQEALDQNKQMQFTLSIQTAISSGLNVAWSNDVFELWILLHFEQVKPGIWLHRNKIYERLTAIMKSIPDQSEEMTAITSRKDFDYKIFLKRRVFFIQFVLPLLGARRSKAIERAKSLKMLSIQDISIMNVILVQKFTIW